MLRKKELKKQRADDLPQIQWSLKVKLVVEKNKGNQLILFFHDCLSIWIALICLLCTIIYCVHGMKCRPRYKGIFRLLVYWIH